MPDAAHRDEMRPGEAVSLLRLRLWLLRTPLALPLVGAVAALLGGACWAVVAAAAALAAVLKLWRVLVCMLLCAAIAALHAGILRRDTERALAAWAPCETVLLEGMVIDVPGRNCLLRVDAAGVVVALRGDEIPYAEGDRVRVRAAPLEVEPPLLPGMFDRAAWMRSRGIAARMELISGERLGHPLSWASLRGLATTMRHQLAERLMPPGTEDDPRRQVLCALVLGARELAEPETMLPFRRGGTLHAFAVSGMHVVLLAGILWVLLRLLGVRAATGRWLQFGLLGIYVVLTGFSVPAVRAYVMLGTVLMGLVLRRRVGLANSWCFAALLVLLVEPWQLYSAGFLLSFAMYAAICLGAGFCLREPSWFGPDGYIPSCIYSPWERWRKLLDDVLRGSVVVSMVAYLVSLPLTSCLFHTLTPWSFVTNMAIALLVPLVMASGLALLCLSAVPLLGAAASWVALRSAGWLLALTSSLAYLPGAYVAATPPQQPEAAMVLGTGYGGSVTVLGNPGLVIDCGNKLTAVLLVEPALFHSGYQPAALLLTQPTAGRSGGEAVLRATWPDMQVMRAKEMGASPLFLEGRAGRWVLYPPPPELPRRPAANGAPIVRWEMPDGRVLLYVGDASRSTWERLPREARRADILILGRNPVQPVDDPDVLQDSGASWVLLLPSAAVSLLEESHVGAGTRLLRLGEKQALALPWGE